MSFFNNLSSLFGTQLQKNSADSSGKSTRQNKQRGKVQPQNLPKPEPIKQKPQSKQQQRQQQNQSQTQNQNQTQVAPSESMREAEAKAREIMVEAKAEALALRSKAERETKEQARQLDEQQRSLSEKLDRLDERLSHMDKKEVEIQSERDEILKAKKELKQQQEKLFTQLEDTANLTREEARKQLLDSLDSALLKEKAQLIRQREEEAKAESSEKVQEILIDAMKHGATDYVPEYTVSVVELPSEDAKGKIIGKSGRNINAFERSTGVDVDLDTSPTEVRLSSFDPVRREIARISLERLIKDGRIQPSRIEEVVAKVKTEIEKTMFEAGKKLCHEIGIYNLPIDLVKMIGKFKFRFSYGQNLIAHTLEETKIGMKLASELGIDVNVVKLGCLLHDIGKVSEEAEGSHVELGVKIAKRFNLPQPVIDAIAQHHEDEPFSGPEQMVVYIADAISGARPGARYENYDEYVKRLQALEEVAMQHDIVKQAYAIQAGREVRVILQPEKTKDDDVTLISGKIRDEIKNTMTYPGTVTVTVIREVRGQEVAT
ncbi:MAG: ribonuclease Y [Patescibacteria group bacterium]